jgi:hypothetical protein
MAERGIHTKKRAKPLNKDLALNIYEYLNRNGLLVPERFHWVK